jgi:hypothetical protein
MALLLFAAALLARGTEPEPDTFLRKQLDVTASDLSRLEQGEIIVKLPKTAETREVAAFAIMRLDVPSEFFVEHVKDIVSFKKSDNALQIGKFSNPPQLKDLDGLTLDPADIEAIRRCRVKNCDVKMSARYIERFRTEVNWSGPEYRQRTTELMREMLLERVQAYLKGGDATLGEYNDKSYALSLPDEFRSLLAPTQYMYQYLPEFQKYLQNFPDSRPNGAESFIYWSKDKFGLKPVVSVTHVTIYKKPGDTGVAIASKGIYADHYYEASLGLTAYINSQSSQPSHTYLIYVNRSRTDALRGLFGGFKRSLINGSLRDGARKSMEAIKLRLEADYKKSVA